MSEEQVAALSAGWQLSPQGKWWNPRTDDGSRYLNNSRAFRYICEDHKLLSTPTEKDSGDGRA